MRKNLLTLVLLLPVAMWLGSCSKPTLLGSELLEEDEAALFFTDTLTLKTTTVKEDSVKTYSLDGPYNSFPCGFMTDPVFGTVKSEIYAQFRQAIQDDPAFENAVFDSLVLTLAYDTTNVYGDSIELQRLEIFRVTEDMDNSKVYYSNATFPVEATAVGTLDFLPHPFAAVPYVSGNDTTQARYVSVRLDDQLGASLVKDSLYENDVFYQFMKGLQIKTANAGPTKTMLNFDMNSTFTRLRLYYTNYTTSDTVSTRYDFIVTGTTSPRLVNFQHDFSGSVVAPYFNNTPKGDSLLFVQAMAGPNVEISIPYLATLGDIVVNKAELEFYVADLPGDDLDIFKPNHQLVLVKKNDSDVFILIDDVVLGPTVFGGDVETIETSGGETMYKYTMNISAMLNTLIASGKADTKLYLRAFPKQETAARVVLYGPGHAQYPAKLKLTYTDINQ